MCGSNWRMGSSPASLESWPGDGSMTSGVPKKFRTCGRAAGILIIGPLGCDQNSASTYETSREVHGFGTG
jgi:hypothetical protein